MPDSTSSRPSPSLCHPLDDKGPAHRPSPEAPAPARGPSGPAGSAEVCHSLDDKTPDPAAAEVRPTGPDVDAAELELRVRNHPGTMSHVTGLFARRGFNLDAIVCAPAAENGTSCMLLLVAGEPRLDQVERQLARLYDVLQVRQRPDLGPADFARLIPSH